MWCIAYHLERGEKGTDYRAAKEARVRDGRAHAALVLDDDGAAQGWCQYGSPGELPNIKHRREYDKMRRRGRTGGSPASTSTKSIAARASPGPRWKAHSARSPKAGGGLVEAISEVTAGREAQSRFLFSATVELFEQHGFSRSRQVGKHAWIVSKVIGPAEDSERATVANP